MNVVERFYLAASCRGVSLKWQLLAHDSVGGAVNRSRRSQRRRERRTIPFLSPEELNSLILCVLESFGCWLLLAAPAVGVDPSGNCRECICRKHYQSRFGTFSKIV